MKENLSVCSSFTRSTAPRTRSHVSTHVCRLGTRTSTVSQPLVSTVLTALWESWMLPPSVYIEDFFNDYVNTDIISHYLLLLLFSHFLSPLLLSGAAFRFLHNPCLCHIAPTERQKRCPLNIQCTVYAVTHTSIFHFLHNHMLHWKSIWTIWIRSPHISTKSSFVFVFSNPV